jgi:hypothetical protein
MKKSYLGKKESGILKVQEKDYDHLLKKIERYELALEEITLVGYSENFGGGWTYTGEYHAKCMNIAREALENN